MSDVKETLEERGKRYGAFKDNAWLAQELKSHIPSGKLNHWQGEAMEMIMHKISRILCGDSNYADSWRDIAGYASLVVDILEEKTHD